MLALDKAAGLQNICVAVLAAMGSLALVACSTATPVAKTAPVAKSADVAGPLVSETGFTLTDNVQIDADTRAQYDNAVRQLEQKQYEQGIASLLKVVQSVPTATAPYIDLGIAYGRTGDFDKAEASFKRALELNPRHPIAYNELGMVYRKKGRFAEARASYEKESRSSRTSISRGSTLRFSAICISRIRRAPSLTTRCISARCRTTSRPRCGSPICAPV